MKIDVKELPPDLEIETIFRNRKTMVIQIRPTGAIKIIAPLGTSNKRVADALESKAGWIRKKLTELHAFPKTESLMDGSILPYLGKDLILKIEASGKESSHKPEIIGKELIVRIEKDRISEIDSLVSDFYKDKTRELVSERIEYYSSEVGTKPVRLSFRDQKTRWASCSSKKTLSFNLRCSMLSPELLDYIIVHELSHLIHMNHSAEFWKHVEEVLPDYKERRKKLKAEGVKIFNLLRRD